MREFVERAAVLSGFDLEWQGSGVDEVGIDTKQGRKIIEINAKYFRPAEVELLLGDPTKANQQLGWRPEVSFGELVETMMRADLAAVGLGDD